GIVCERRERPTTDRALAPLSRLVSEDVVVPPAMMRVCEDVAERCAGTVGDVLRLALPPRHARAEKNDRAAAEKAAQSATDTTAEIQAEPETGAEAAVQVGAAQGAPPEPPRPGDRYAGLAALISRAGAPRARSRAPPSPSMPATAGSRSPPMPSATSAPIGAPWPSPPISAM